MHSSGELFMNSREGYLGFVSQINTKITLQWVHKQFITRVHTLFCLLHDITNPSMTIKTTIFTHRFRVSLARLTFCWWHHNRFLMMSQWPDSCDAITWIVISNSLVTDLIHGDIHGRRCKKFGELCINFSQSDILLIVSVHLFIYVFVFSSMVALHTL